MFQIIFKLIIRIYSFISISIKPTNKKRAAIHIEISPNSFEKINPKDEPREKIAIAP